jgi:CBS domain containing-hemolysin-like protein
MAQLEILPNIPLIPTSCSLAKALREFEKGTGHMAAVISD